MQKGQFRTCGHYLIISALLRTKSGVDQSIIQVQQALISEGDGKLSSPVDIPVPQDGTLPDPYYDPIESRTTAVFFYGRVNFAVFGMTWKEYVARFNPDLA